jgi:hypothetical protein
MAGAGPAPEPAPAVDPHRAPTVEGPGDPARLELDLAAPPPGSELAPAYASLELDLPLMPDTKPTEDMVGRADTRRTGEPDEPPDLVASLPTPKPGTTRPFPSKTRPPAFDPISGLSGPGGAAASLAATLAAAKRTPQTDPGNDRPTRDLTQEPTEPALKAANAPPQELPYVMKLDPRLAIHPDPQHAPLAGPASVSSDFADRPTDQFAGRPAPRSDAALITAPTRELGLRELAPRPEPVRSEPPRRRALTEDENTGQTDVFKPRPPRSPSQPEIPGMDPIDARSAEILEQIDRGAPASETREDRTRRRITALLERAAAWSRDADFDRAVTAVDLALSEDPNSALAQKLIHRNREAIMNAFQAFLGDLQRTPALARPLHELASAPISPRAAFLLSRVDGTLSLDEILDVSGMPRMEAYRYLCQLFLRGILR